MRKTRKIASAALAVTLVAGMTMGTTTAYARSSKRAAWNNASSAQTTGSTVKDRCYVEDGSESEEHTVYSNVYANSEEWAAFKAKWDSIKSNYEQITLSPGNDATELNTAWYSLTKETPAVKLMDANGAELSIYQGEQNLSNAETITVDDVDVTLYPNKVTIKGLTENTAYKYAYYVDGKWSETYDYSTKSTDSFSMLYVGDPQIGASTNQLGDQTKEYYAMNDTYNWQHTLANAVSAHSNVSFMLSAGDQINQTSVGDNASKVEQQIEYAGFLSCSQLRSLPIATTIGNHDSKSINYSNHFNNANVATSDITTAGATAAGTDYYFSYGNTLFVVIDTNNYNSATHKAVIDEATKANPNATWKVLMFHQDIYGSGYDHSDSDGIALRTALTPIINEYGFDAVLQGHDHTYSRTYQLASTGKEENETCYNILSEKNNTNKVVDPEGTVYFEANSSTGSKFYQLIGTQQDYIAARSQSWRPTYSVIDVTDTTFTVKTYDAATNTELVADGDIATSYTIVKQADKKALSTEIASAKTALEVAKNAGNYTEESVNTLDTTITAAQAIMDDETANSVAVASAITSLEDAINGLKVVEDSNNGNTGDNTDNSNTSDTDSNVENDDNSANTGNGAGSNSTVTSNPKTGDSAMPMIMWFAVAGCSLAGLSGIVVSERKRKKAENTVNEK